ncbi:lipopolysaccharide biosynthesis protein [Geomonas edaphica]|uniref:lipopolysaccharide biosynthesis protein n=1 Tax=Geomonas edaphica TaxID=2570226 RepID=UPI0010A87F6F|nr:oligosaccharide flippase family protein [Geomonas edaphica]
MSRADKAAKGVLTSFLQYGCQIGLQVFLAPLVLAVAGQETFGAYAIIMQAVAYLALTDMGFSLALTRFLSQAFGYDDGKHFETVLTTSRTIVLFTNILFSILLLLLALWGQHWFSFSREIALQTKYALGILAIWTILRTPWQIFQTGLNASQNMSSANMIGIVGNVFKLLFSLGLLYFGMGLIGLMLANIVSEGVIILLCYRRFKSLYPNIKPYWGLPDRNLTREMFSFGKHALFINLAWRLVSGTDNLVVGFLYGAAATSIYYTTQMPSVVGYLFVNRLVDNFGPAINELYSRKDVEKLKDLFLSVHRYTLLLGAPLFVGILLLNRHMIEVWVGSAQYAGDLMTFALAGFALLNVIGHVNMVFVIATGELSQLSRFAFYEGVANLGLSFLLGYYYGLSGVMLATFIAHIPMAIYLQYRGMAALDMYFNQYITLVISPVVVPCMIATICASIVVFTMPATGWLSFICACSVLLLVHVGLAYLLAINVNERAWIRHKLFRLGPPIRA